MLPLTAATTRNTLSAQHSGPRQDVPGLGPTDWGSWEIHKIKTTPITEDIMQTDKKETYTREADSCISGNTFSCQNMSVVVREEQGEIDG